MTLINPLSLVQKEGVSKAAVLGTKNLVQKWTRFFLCAFSYKVC